MNRITGAAIAATAALIAGSSGGASAAVRYDIVYPKSFGFTYGFDYTAPDFITSDLTVPGASLDSCLSGCDHATFSFNNHDTVLLTAPYFGGLEISQAANFPTGTFGSPGTYSGDGATLTITNLNPPPAPEPATWAMMLAGFGGLGLAMRSRRKQAGGRRLIEP